MPARNRYHRQLRRALENDGWTITHDPLHLKFGGRDMLVDLGAERLLAAEKAEQRVAVELHSFVGPSEVEDLQKAVGQFTLYEMVLARTDPERKLFLAVSHLTFDNLFQEPLGQLLIDGGPLRLVVFDPFQEELRQWIS
jgi:hypothetical protein